MDRRNFLKVTATGALIAISPSLITTKLHANVENLYLTYEKVQLVDANGVPIKASALKKETNYIFNYPYTSTPAILLDLEIPTAQNVSLKSEDGQEYIWKTGVGSKRTIVAYSAICSHQLAHPTPDDSFLQYCRKDQKTIAYEHGGVMVCSSHLSVFDVQKGCKTLAGPAAQPLASIVIEVADDDTLWAVAVLGPDKFHEYFKAFKPEFKKYYGGKKEAKKFVTTNAKMVNLNEYTKEIIQY
jgi:Rieske Fe-S protein